MDSEDAFKSPKDCRVCNRRRIRCGRSLPTCSKCIKKNLPCSGYGITLKWDQGVASRGRLAGRTVPVTPQTRPVPIEPPLKTPAHQDCSSTSVTRIPLFPSIPSFSSPPLERQNVRFLLNHYYQVVAANMTWAGSPENPWRDIIIPMAMESPLVLLSILTFAAKHISTMAQRASLDEDSRRAAGYSRLYGNQALKLLAQELYPLVSEPHNGLPTIAIDIQARRRHNTLLATMLVLCNVETVRPDSTVWRVHLNTARTMLMSQAEVLSSEDSLDAAAIFLRQELSIASTFACLTSFSPSSDGDHLFKEPGGPFAEFLRLLHMVTRLERQAFAEPESVRNSGVSANGFQQLFENARARTLKLSKTLKFSSAETRLEFNRIVNSFYHAGLTYTYRALSSVINPPGSSPAHSLPIESRVTAAVVELFQILNTTEMKKPVFAQDLVWPVFIAGTEARKVDEQDMVVQKLEQAMQGTGFSNCEHALEFLRALWIERAKSVSYKGSCGRKEAMDQSWIPFARSWEQKGHVFWVF